MPSPGRSPFLVEDPMEWVARHPFLDVRVTNGLPSDEMGGWAADADVILLADDLDVREQRATLAHELVHRMYGDRPEHHDYGAREARCQDVTARLLLPVGELLRVLPPVLEQAAGALGVDVATLTDRLRGLTDDEAAAVWS